VRHNFITQLGKKSAGTKRQRQSPKPYSLNGCGRRKPRFNFVYFQLSENPPNILKLNIFPDKSTPAKTSQTKTTCAKAIQDAACAIRR
jgi:hypothetical protein